MRRRVLLRFAAACDGESGHDNLESASQESPASKKVTHSGYVARMPGDNRSPLREPAAPGGNAPVRRRPTLFARRTLTQLCLRLPRATNGLPFVATKQATGAPIRAAHRSRAGENRPLARGGGGFCRRPRGKLIGALANAEGPPRAAVQRRPTTGAGLVRAARAARKRRLSPRRHSKQS